MKIKYYPLNHFNERPADITIDTIVIHSMYAKGQSKPTAALPCFKILDENKVSSHFSIDRLGTVWQHVEDSKRAWHAGKSSMPPSAKHPSPRENVNDFSIGIEMIGVWSERFRARQYRSLIRLIAELLKKFPIETIVSHQSIAPDRKNDPGPSFRWDILRRGMRRRKIHVRILS